MSKRAEKITRELNGLRADTIKMSKKIAEKERELRAIIKKQQEEEEIMLL